MNTYVIILEMAIILLSICIYAYLYWRSRECAPGLWCLAASGLGAPFIVASVYDLSGVKDLPLTAQFVEWTSFFTSAFLVCWGVFLFVRKPFPKYLIFAWAIIILLNCFHTFYYRYYIIDILIYIFHSVCFILAGIVLLSTKDISGVWKFIGGTMMLLMGVISVSSIFLYRLYTSVLIRSMWNRPEIYMVYAIIGIVMTIGLQVTYYQKKIQQDAAQRRFMQSASHELKTQAMIVRNYAQMIVDGVLPEETLADSLKAINDETRVLEKRVRGMLHNKQTGKPQGT